MQSCIQYAHTLPNIRWYTMYIEYSLYIHIILCVITFLFLTDLLGAKCHSKQKQSWSGERWQSVLWFLWRLQKNEVHEFWATDSQNIATNLRVNKTVTHYFGNVFNITPHQQSLYMSLMKVIVFSVCSYSNSYFDF